MTRIAITGGPRTGKTTMAEQLRVEVMEQGVRLHVPLRHTDDLHQTEGSTWSSVSRDTAMWMDEPGPWIIEGVAVSRALRKWHEAHPGEPPPVDRVIYCGEPRVDTTPHQRAMAKGVRTVHDEIEGWLEEHSITTEYL